jgi:hypothetical protein
VGLLQVAHRARVVAQAERDEREVERRDRAWSDNFLLPSTLEAAVSITGCPYA